MSLLSQLKHLFGWNKYYYLTSLALTTLAGIFYYINIDVLKIIGVPLFVVSMVFSFLSFQKDHFSIKYLQSLPLSKKELYHFKILDSLVNLLPLFFWGVIFHDVVLDIFAIKKVSGLIGFIQLVFLYILGSLLISIWSFFRQYEATRLPYVAGNRRTLNYLMVRTGIYYFALVMYAIYSFIAIVWILKAFAPQFLLDMSHFFSKFKNIWTFLAIVGLYTQFEYKRVFARWLDEKRSYVKHNWRPVRDVPLMALTLVLVILPPGLLIQSSSSEYGKLNLIETVRTGKIIEVEKLIAAGTDINSRSDIGYTALMAAAHLGDEKMYFYLLSKGASKAGKVSSKAKRFADMDLAWLAIYGGNEAIVKDLIHSQNANRPLHAYYPIHVAADRCHERVIDILLELGADPNAKFKSRKNKTPLHIATERSCMNGVISLIEAGADINERDDMGKLAFDYVRDWKKDLHYYLEKKTRSPAGKK